jgi:SAM-dependent methyltransferase
MTVTSFDAYERRMWAGRAEAYSRSFAGLCAHPATAVLDAAAAAAGSRVLDVGTGTGTVAALAVHRAAEVIAADAEASMAELARANVPGARVLRAALPDLPFAAAAFDAVVANFVVNHVGDPVAAVTELRRVLRPGGRVAVSVWPQLQPPLQSLWQEVIDAAGLVRPAIPSVATDKNFDRTPAGLADLLRRAGLGQVVSETVTWQHHVDIEEWWLGPASGLGSLGMVMRGHRPDTVARVKRHYDTLAARYLVGGGQLALPTTALIASGSA